jgi:hypothetical protein
LPVGNECWFGYEWSPDTDAYLVNPSGIVVAMSRCMLEATNGNCAAPGRFETLGIASAAAGTWKLRVESFSGAGSFEATVVGALGTEEPPPPPPPPPTPPAAPTLSAQPASTSRIDLGWTDVAGEQGYTLDRCSGAGCTTFVTIATLPAGTAAYADTGLATGTTYVYRVHAFNGDGASAWSNSATATTHSLTAPSAPTGLNATVAAGRVTLRCTDTSSNEAGFRVLRCAGPKCTPTAVVAHVDAGVVTWIDLGVLARKTYRYRVQAFNDGGVATSSILTVKTPR